MRQSSTPLRFLCRAALLATFPAVVSAGVAQGGVPADARGLGEIESIDTRAIGTTTHKERILRCWQKGQLIIERRVDQVPAEAAQAVRVAVDGCEALRLYDLDNATCLID